MIKPLILIECAIMLAASGSVEAHPRLVPVMRPTIVHINVRPTPVFIRPSYRYYPRRSLGFVSTMTIRETDSSGPLAPPNPSPAAPQGHALMDAPTDDVDASPTSAKADGQPVCAQGKPLGPKSKICVLN